MSVQRFAVLFVTAILCFCARAQDAVGAELWKRPLRIALVQLRTENVGDFSKMRSLAHRAKEGGADLVVFPEESVFGWLNPAAFTQAAPIPGKYSDQFAEIARSEHIWLATGLAERGPKAGAGAQPDAYQAYDSAILLDPWGRLILHHRQFEVVKNAFDPSACQTILNEPSCNYIPGELSDIVAAHTPFGSIVLLVCDDAYTYNTQALDKVKTLQPDYVVVPWGITAAVPETPPYNCGNDGFNATGYGSTAANYLGFGTVFGADGVGPRDYGRFLPSEYCGTSGYAVAKGAAVEAPQPTEEIAFFNLPAVKQ